MSFFHLLRVETGRLLRARLTWVAIAISALSPLAGLWLYRPIGSTSAYGYSSSLNAMAIGNPALAGALFGAIVFAVLAAINLHNRQRFQTDVMTEAVRSTFQLNAAQTLSLLLTACMAQVVTLMVWAPYSVMQLGSVFSLALYLSSYLTIMLPALCFAVLFTAAAYQITRRLDLSLVLFAAFALLSLTALEENWLLRWVNPALSYLSDDFGNSRRIMSIGYNRLFWLLALSGLWALSFLCIRRYGKGLPGSVSRNLRKVYIPMLAAVLACSSGVVYASQPFVDHSPELLEFSNYYYSDAQPAILCSSIDVDARPNLSTGSFYADVTYTLKNPTATPQTVSFQVNPGYTFSAVTANGQPVAFRDLANDDMNMKSIEVDLPADDEIELVLTYGGFPQEWNISALMQGDLEISKDYIYLSNADFSPLSDTLAYDELRYTADINLPTGMTPVLFGAGETQNRGANPDGTLHWQLINGSSSIILYAGDYVSHHIDAAGMDVEFYYSQKHSRAMDEYNVDHMIKNVFEYCTDRIGPLSFMTGETMKLIEIGTYGGGYAGLGASVMGEDSFSQQGLSDPLKGAGGDEVLAHEIVHQWWGLGNMFDVSDENSVWSAEGLTVYTTYRLMKELHGQEYATKNYVEIWQGEVDRYYDNFYVRNPQYFDALSQAYQADILNSFTQMRQYCEMPLMILKAEALVGGEEAFDQILYEMFNRAYLEDYSNVYLSYDIFLEYCGLTKEDLQLG